MRSKPFPLRGLISIAFFLSWFGGYYHVSCRLISHINAKGIKGNITFNIQDSNGVRNIIIESFLESGLSDLNSTSPKTHGEVDLSQPILLDWSIHLNPIDPSALSCSEEDLGPAISDALFQDSIPKFKPIILNKSNQLIVAFPKDSSSSTLSSMLWGKSIRIKLSQFHVDGAQIPDRVQSNSRPHQPKPALRPSLSTSSSSSSHPVALNQPATHRAYPFKSPSIVGGGKPTFAPRVRPTLQVNKVKPSKLPQALPKPLALTIETSSQTQPPSSFPPPVPTTSGPEVFSSHSTEDDSPTTPAPKNASMIETHRRIVRVFGKTMVCGNIIETGNIKTAEANFESQVAGKIRISGNEDDTTLLMINLYHVRSKVTTRHEWKIMASDILDTRRQEERCKYLQFLFDPNNTDDSDCKRGKTTKCKMGDLTRKHGQIQVAGQGKNTRTTLVDLNLPLSALEGSRSLYFVIYEVATKFTNTGLPTKANVLGCAMIKSTAARILSATINMDGVRGFVRLTQRHPTEPTTISYDLFGLESNIKHQSIRELPLERRTSTDNALLCNSLGDVFNPNKIVDSPSEIPLTVDMYRVGNLSAKHGQLSVIDSEYEDHYMSEFLDPSLQLFGTNSVAGRSVVIHKNNGDPWVCATFNYVDNPTSLAVATFNYPVVGRISFQQLAGDPFAETSVLVEVYNPNGDRNSDGHNWMVHVRPAMADFYNWSQRCESAGQVYDPIQASTGLNNDVYALQCQASTLNEPLRCRSGDTSIKSGIKLALPLSPLNRSRYYYTDLFLPLSGPFSIVGKSVVIYDESSPAQRGNRLACSTIKVSRPLKASVESWDSGPSIPSAVRGSFMFEQEAATRPTRIKVDLGGLNGSVENYAIHSVWTMDDREFPCSHDSLYDIYDPSDKDHSSRLPPSSHYGSLATVDRVKVGDFSRKHGTFEGLQSVQRTLVDADAPLFAPRSIIGRSMVLRAAANDFRWVCGNIELKYDASESRAIVGMASFDEPRSKVSGYIRFTQLEHNDGSLSDTYMQLDLRPQSDGGHELPTSEGHNWSVFVNQVGEDAFIAADDVRCIAAGFKWNPYLAQDSKESYQSSCGPAEPLACSMGDLGMRHGSLTLGPNNRRTLADENLPLAGNYSVMGRSVVIFDNKRPNVKLACANIFPDVHLKSNVVIKRTPSFTVARFAEQMRSLLGAADWLLVPELRATRAVANGECVQMTIHFYGQRAHQLQIELNNLITLGTVRKSTRLGTSDKISTHYRLCRAGQQ